LQNAAAVLKLCFLLQNDGHGPDNISHSSEVESGHKVTDTVDSSGAHEVTEKVDSSGDSTNIGPMAKVNLNFRSWVFLHINMKGQ
jgi:hypothetical protein